MKNIVKLVDLLMVTRPIVLIPVWGFSSLGFIEAILKKNSIIIKKTWETTNSFLYINILMFSLSVASVYVMNQLADIEADKKNGGLPLIASGIVSEKSAKWIIFFTTIIPLTFFAIFKEFILLCAVIITLFIGYIYSFRPLRFSGRPFLDFLSNALGYGIIAFGVGYTLGGKNLFNKEFLFASLPYFFLMAAGSISSTIPDYEGDAADNKKTTAVTLGILPSHTLALFFLLVSLSIAFIKKDLIVLLSGFPAIPFYIGYYFKRKRFFLEATYKIGGAICVLVSFVGLPFFFIISTIVFIITFLYFRICHGTTYPSLKKF